MKTIVTAVLVSAFAIALVGCAKSNDTYNPNSGQVVTSHHSNYGKLGKMGSGAANSDNK